MAIEINVGSIDAVPENLRPFVTEAEGKFSLDETKLKTETDVEKVLEAKRKEANDHKDTKEALRPYRELGKTPEELAELLKGGGKPAEAGMDPTRSPEYLTLKKSFDELKSQFGPMHEAYQKAEAEKVERHTRDAVDKLIDSLDAKYDKELVRDWARDAMGHFKLNAISELDDINGVKPLDFIVSKADKLKFHKATTPSRFNGGRVENPNAERNGAAEGGDTALAALQNAPEVE